MKKYFIFIFICLACLPVAGKAGKVVHDNHIHSSQLDVYADESIHLAHSELEISTVHGGSAAHVWQVAKKVTGNKELVASQHVSFYSEQFPGSRSANFFYAKSYLLHIYPSHNFW